MISKKNSFYSHLIAMIVSFNYIIAQNINSENHILDINMESKGYYGPGLDWILNKSDSVQFFLFGEQHGIKAIPKLTNTIYSKLNTNNCYSLALEMDQWTSRKIFEEGLEEIISKYPYSIAFDYDSDLKLINSIDRKSEIWGLDQIFTAIHPYQRLIEIAPNESARRLVQGAYLKAALKMGKYISQPHFKDLESIRNAFGPEISDEANLILDQLKISMEIYVAYKAGRQGDISRQVTVEMREAFMMRQFDHYLNKNPKQKVVLKMGGAHTVMGIGPNGVETLGNYTKKIADKNNLKSLHLSLFNYHNDLQFVNEDIFKYSDAVLIDTKALLKRTSDSLLNSFSETNKLLLTQNDAIILFNNSDRSEKTIITSHEKNFKSNLIKKISPVGVLIVLCLTIFVPLSLYKFSKSEKNNSYKAYGKLLTSIFIIVLFTIAIFAVQIDAILTFNARAIILNGYSSIWLYIALLFVAVYFVYKMLLFLKKEKTKKKHKVYLTVVVASYLLLVSYMYYWNIGGMISF